MSADELNIYFHATTGDAGAGPSRNFSASRRSASDPFGGVALVPGLEDPGATFGNGYATYTSDALLVFFESTRPGPGSSLRVWTATRGNAIGAFGEAKVVAALGDPASQPFLSADATELYATAGKTIVRVPVSATGILGQRSELTLGAANTNQLPVLSADKLTLYFASDRPGKGKLDIWRATRQRTEDQFGDDVHAVDELNTADNDVPSWLSPDGCRLYIGFATIRVASKVP